VPKIFVLIIKFISNQEFLDFLETAHKVVEEYALISSLGMENSGFPLTNRSLGIFPQKCRGPVGQWDFPKMHTKSRNFFLTLYRNLFCLKNTFGQVSESFLGEF
jgi:hypothetical protein